jgi:hypothetical protein
MRYQEKASARRGLLLLAILALAWRGTATADTAGAVDSPLDALASTAAVIEGRVTAIASTYDRVAGPRTIATLADVRAHLGSYDGRTLDVAMLGGRITDEKWLFIPELPRLTQDTRYVVFLTNAEWFYSPVVEEYVFQLETGPRGSDVLIAPTGHAVVGLSAEGLAFSSDPVVDTQLDFLRPYAKPRLLAPSLLANAMSKEAFLAAVADLSRTVPLRGELRTSPAGDRVWDEMLTEEE